MLLIGVEITVLSIAVATGVSVALGFIGYVIRSRSTSSRYAEGKALALLVDAHAVEQMARALFDSCREDLALYDAHTPLNLNHIGHGKRGLMAKLAIYEAVFAQRAVELDLEVGIAKSRLHQAAQAFVLVYKKSLQARAMVITRDFA